MDSELTADAFPTGVFKCEFSEGSVKHTAMLGLNVALLPDPVTMLMTPLVVDCSEGGAASLPVIVTTIIPPSSENFKVTWAYRGDTQGELKPEGEQTSPPQPRLGLLLAGNEGTRGAMHSVNAAGNAVFTLCMSVDDGSLTLPGALSECIVGQSVLSARLPASKG